MSNAVRTVDPQELRIQVGVYDDPTEAVRDALGADDRALRLETEPASFITVDGCLWAVAKEPGGDWREGPAVRENVLAGLARAESVAVVPIDETPITGEASGHV